MKTRSSTGRKYIWTKQDLKFLKDNFFSMTNRELATHLRLTLTLVRTKCYELGLKRMELEYWTKRQINFLVRNYRWMGDQEIAEIFNEKYPKNKNWTKKHIEKKRGYLKLKRTQRQIDQIKIRNIERGCFSFNHWKRWIGRITPVGQLRVRTNHKTKRQVVVIKTKAGFVHYAPWLYRKEVGRIKPGYVIRIKDNNPLNVIPENLVMVSRAEHARLNVQLIMALPEDLRATMRALNKLNRKLLEYEKQD